VGFFLKESGNHLERMKTMIIQLLIGIALTILPINHEVLAVKEEQKITQPVIQVKKEETIKDKVYRISKEYDVDPNLILSIIYHESEFNPRAYNGICIGLMQIYKRYHKDRMKRLHITNLYDPESNIRMGVDYIAELQKQYKDERLVLMLYNMNNATARRLYKRGIISKYAKNVIKRKQYYQNGGTI